MNKKRFREWLSIHVAKNPRRVIIAAILLFNLVFLGVAAFVISRLAPEALKGKGFWASVFYTLSMILDAGCVSYVVEDVGTAGVALILICLATILVGMVTFTGAMIGYMSNYISNFIDNANAGNSSLIMSGHTVVLNWNTRGAEIINDLLYSGKPEKVVVLVSENREDVEKEIANQLEDTLMKEKKLLLKKYEENPLKNKNVYMKLNELKNKLTVIVREGDTFSLKQLNDISLSRASAVVILGRDLKNTICAYGQKERLEANTKGDTNIIKTLIQVSEITAAEDSADEQKIIVEVDDNWTMEIVDKIIKQKEKAGKCNIVPIAVNKILGQLLSQFSVMPELNLVYNELFSNKGAAFYCTRQELPEDENKELRTYLMQHRCAVPVGYMNSKTGPRAYFMAKKEEDIQLRHQCGKGDYHVRVNTDYWLKKKNIIILGHNSKSEDIMEGFDAFRGEWNRKDGSEILNIMVVDSEENLKKHGHFKKYSYVNRVIPADVYDKGIIYEEVGSFIEEYEEVSILILSDDMVRSEDFDAEALIYLIYVREIIDAHKKDVNVIVEIINPKNYDVAVSYSINNVVISNRYISKLVTQISEKEALFEFYNDILTYDDENSEVYESKEIYIKEVAGFFRECPEVATAEKLVRAIFDATPENNKAIALGYVDAEGNMHLFSGDQGQQKIELTENDKMIVFSNH